MHRAISILQYHGEQVTTRQDAFLIDEGRIPLSTKWLMPVCVMHARVRVRPCCLKSQPDQEGNLTTTGRLYRSNSDRILCGVSGG